MRRPPPRLEDGARDVEGRRAELLREGVAVAGLELVDDALEELDDGGDGQAARAREVGHRAADAVAEEGRLLRTTERLCPLKT